MNGTRAERIEAIIARRQPLAVRLRNVSGHLKTLSVTLLDLQETRDRVLSAIADHDVATRLRSIDPEPLRLQIEDATSLLAKLQARFARDTLNVGVVGRARQGKSRLLQSLTGLTTVQIPDGDREHCTGVRSTVYHRTDLEPYGEIVFHSERSFLDEVIAPYYSREQLNLGPPPVTIAEFGNQPLPPLPANTLKSGSPVAKYTHLESYKCHLSRYRSLLQEPASSKIPIECVREYVAQDTVDGQREYFNHMAVREARIFCCFPHTDVGRIAFIDMPGLGDTGLGDDKRLMQTLRQDVDVVLFVRLPETGGASWVDVDVALYEIARDSLPDLPIRNWAFMVLNRTRPGSKKGDNAANCDDFVKSIARHGIDVVDCITADCSDGEEVHRSILDRVLDFLAGNMEGLDEQFSRTAQEAVMRIQGQAERLAREARTALGQVSETGAEYDLFLRLFNKVWDRLTNGIEGLIRDLRDRRDDEDNAFRTRVGETIDACYSDSGVPSCEEIERERNVRGGYQPACNQLLDRMRTHLTDHFLTLDDTLKSSVDGVKAKVAGVLLDSGLLAPLTRERDAQFLSGMAAQLPPHLCHLCTGFQILSDFEVAYRGLVQHRLRRQIDCLTPDGCPHRVSAKPSAEEVRRILERSHGEALRLIEEAFEDWLCEPNQAAFAIVEEFSDHVLRTEGARDEWQRLYHEARSDIWPTEFEQIGHNSRLRRQWHAAADQVASAARVDLFRFLTETPRG